MTITIQSCELSNGNLNVVYARNGDSGGHGIRFQTSRGSDDEIREGELEQFVLRLIYTWGRRRGVSPAQMVGKTIDFDASVLRNVLSIA